MFQSNLSNVNENDDEVVLPKTTSPKEPMVEKKTSNENKQGYDRLFDDVWAVVFSFLNSKELLSSVYYVNKYFQSIIKHATLAMSNTVGFTDSPKNRLFFFLKYLKTRYHNLKTIECRNRFLRWCKQNNVVLSHVKCVYFEGDLYSERRDGSSMDMEAFYNVVPNCKNLYINRSYDSLNIKDFSTIKKLDSFRGKLSTKKDQWENNQHELIEKISYFSNLKKLQLTNVKLDHLFFILTYTNQLKSLFCKISSRKTKSKFYQKENMISLDHLDTLSLQLTRSHTLEEFLKIVKLTKLCSLRINTTDRIPSLTNPLSPLRKSIKSSLLIGQKPLQTALSELILKNKNISTFHTTFELDTIINSLNFEKLTEFVGFVDDSTVSILNNSVQTITKLKIFVIDRVEGVNLPILEKMTNLLDLTIFAREWEKNCTFKFQCLSKLKKLYLKISHGKRKNSDSSTLKKIYKVLESGLTNTKNDDNEVIRIFNENLEEFQFDGRVETIQINCPKLIKLTANCYYETKCKVIIEENNLHEIKTGRRVEVMILKPAHSLKTLYLSKNIMSFSHEGVIPSIDSLRGYYANIKNLEKSLLNVKSLCLRDSKIVKKTIFDSVKSKMKKGKRGVKKSITKGNSQIEFKEFGEFLSKSFHNLGTLEVNINMLFNQNNKKFSFKKKLKTSSSYKILSLKKLKLGYYKNKWIKEKEEKRSFEKTFKFFGDVFPNLLFFSFKNKKDRIDSYSWVWENLSKKELFPKLIGIDISRTIYVRYMDEKSKIKKTINQSITTTLKVKKLKFLNFVNITKACEIKSSSIESLSITGVLETIKCLECENLKELKINMLELSKKVLETLFGIPKLRVLRLSVKKTQSETMEEIYQAYTNRKQTTKNMIIYIMSIYFSKKEMKPHFDLIQQRILEVAKNGDSMMVMTMNEKWIDIEKEKEKIDQKIKNNYDDTSSSDFSYSSDSSSSTSTYSTSSDSFFSESSSDYDSDYSSEDTYTDSDEEW